MIWPEISFLVSYHYYPHFRVAEVQTVDTGIEMEQGEELYIDDSLAGGDHSVARRGDYAQVVELYVEREAEREMTDLNFHACRFLDYVAGQILDCGLNRRNVDEDRNEDDYEQNASYYPHGNFPP